MKDLAMVMQLRQYMKKNQETGKKSLKLNDIYICILHFIEVNCMNDGYVVKIAYETNPGDGEEVSEIERYMTQVQHE